MATEIKVPTLGKSVNEATVARWLKQPGDTVAMDDPLVELETDKVTLEVNAPAAGTLTEVLAAEGANVGVGAVLGVIGEGAAKPAPAAAKPAPAAAKPAPAAPAAAKPAPAPATQWRRRYSHALRSRGAQSRRRDRRRCDEDSADRQGWPRHQERYRCRCREARTGTRAGCPRAAAMWARAKSACA